MDFSQANDKFMEQFRSGGALPTGAVSIWPKGRKILELEEIMNRGQKVKPSIAEQARNMARTAKQVAKGGKVSKTVRTQRLDTCLDCPSFIEKSRRCAECGCFMDAKTWVNADPLVLCPLQKWLR